MKATTPFASLKLLFSLVDLGLLRELLPLLWRLVAAVQSFFPEGSYSTVNSLD